MSFDLSDAHAQSLYRKYTLVLLVISRRLIANA